MSGASDRLVGDGERRLAAITTHATTSAVMLGPRPDAAVTRPRCTSGRPSTHLLSHGDVAPTTCQVRYGSGERAADGQSPARRRPVWTGSPDASGDQGFRLRAGTPGDQPPPPERSDRGRHGDPPPTVTNNSGGAVRWLDVARPAQIPGADLGGAGRCSAGTDRHRRARLGRGCPMTPPESLPRPGDCRARRVPGRGCRDPGESSRDQH